MLTNSKPLFLPLKREYFEAFERLDKKVEIRRYGARWNERTCPVGRKVTISLGYGKAQRMTGVIRSFRRDYIGGLPWDLRRDAIAIYGVSPGTLAVIGIELVKEHLP